jgi:hypothetical protein
VVISFVALAVLWKSPHLQEPRAGRALPLQRLWRSRVASVAARSVAFALFAVVLIGALGGDPVTNLAPVAVYVWLWVGLAFAHSICGNLWRVLSPWDTLARVLGIGRTSRRPYPKALGAWPATVFLFVFVWLELVAPFGARPLILGVMMAAYTALTLVGMAAYGRDEWQQHGEAFAVYFALLARIAPFERDTNGVVRLRPVLGALPQLPPVPGGLAFILVLLGSTTYDGFSRNPVWSPWIASLPDAGKIAAGTAGMLAIILLLAGAYALAMLAAARVAGARWHPLAVSFAHSLVPIAFAYVVAHYFSLLLIEGQQGLALISDPFGVGWNLLGTADWKVNLTIVSAATIWYVQVASIVGGHVGGVVLAHDRAVALFPARTALRTQYALLAVMVLFTLVGLLILSGG